MHIVLVVPDRTTAGSGGGAIYLDGLSAALESEGHRIDVSIDPAASLPACDAVVVDSMLLPRLRHRWQELRGRDCVILVHHVSAAAGRDPDSRDEVHTLERELLADVRRVIATSEPVAARLTADYGVTAAVITPGAHDLPRSTPDRDPPLLVAIGVLTSRKGHDRLVRALARLTDLPWKAAILGDDGREPAHATGLAALIDELKLRDRCRLFANPEPEVLEQAWRSASVFALATTWEGYPAAIAEALRRGIPVVTTAASNAAGLLPAAAGALMSDDDMATFGKCLRRVLFDTALRREMADGAWAAGRLLPDWPTQATAFRAILES